MLILFAAAGLDLSTWSMLVGALLPPLVAVVQQPRWPSWLRAVVGVVSCMIAGAITVWLTGNLAWDGDLLGSIIRVIIASQATYVAFWKKTGVAPSIEGRTSPGG